MRNAQNAKNMTKMKIAKKDNDKERKAEMLNRQRSNLTTGMSEEELLEESSQVHHFWKAVRSSAEAQKRG